MAKILLLLHTLRRWRTHTTENTGGAIFTNCLHLIVHVRNHAVDKPCECNEFESLHKFFFKMLGNM